NLGILYENGDGVEQNYAKAFECYQAAAEQGNPIAQYYAGSMYYYGKGVEQSFIKSLEYYKPAAEQGNSDA
ncbi:tetratricopeptide repeat protein, partial [Snodgrassella alvi]|uniref:tetratricopeptide repeat protein n=3 Tax=Snodgrassella TaxID=1193515 RepID=UPI0011859BD4